MTAEPKCETCEAPARWLPYVGGDDDPHRAHVDDDSWADAGCKRKLTGQAKPTEPSADAELGKRVEEIRAAHHLHGAEGNWHHYAIRDLLTAIDAAARREKIAVEALRFASEFVCGHHIQLEPGPIRKCRTARLLNRNSWCIPCRASEALDAIKEGK